jgi:hypothetical protein
MGLRLILLLSASAALVLITVLLVPSFFDVAYWHVEGPGFVVIGIDDMPHNVTLFTEEGFDLWMKKLGSAVFNGVIRRGDALIIETPPGRYILAVYPQPFPHDKTQTYAKSYSGWAPVDVVPPPRKPLVTNAVAGYFGVHKLKAQDFEPNGRPGVNGVSIQLNAIVVLELADGNEQYYFVQNAILIRTDEGKYSFMVNIFNHTSRSKDLSREAVRGRGDVHWDVHAPSYYRYRTREERYSLPLEGFLLINVSAAGGAARIDLGYNVGDGFVWYDSVAIKPYAPVERAYIPTGPVRTPIGTIVSLELVLCGNGMAASPIGTSSILCTPPSGLDEMAVELMLLVWDGARWWWPVPRIFNSGINTEEAVALDVDTRPVNGTAHITEDTFKPQLLAEEPPKPDIPSPNAAKTPHVDTYLILALATLIFVVASGIWISRRTSRAIRRSFRRAPLGVARR